VTSTAPTNPSTALKVAGIAAAVLTLGSALSGCSSDRKQASETFSATPAAPTSSAPVAFEGVTVTGGSELTAKPGVTSKSSATPAALQVKDLVVGSGAVAKPTSTVTVQYVGVRYADGKQFDASWDHGGAVGFSLQQVGPGVTRGIGGTTGVAPMKVGGRRLMILPAALGYGSTGTQDGSIPPNAAIVFVVDLVGVK
jgi:peptidylprolyl isomerase